MIIIETHRIMGVDREEYPDATKMQARGHDDSLGGYWTTVASQEEPGFGEVIGCTVPGGRLEIYGR